MKMFLIRAELNDPAKNYSSFCLIFGVMCQTMSLSIPCSQICCIMRQQFCITVGDPAHDSVFHCFDTSLVSDSVIQK